MSTAEILTIHISSLILQMCFGWCDHCLLVSAETGIFGVPLTTLLENDQKKFPGSKVPLVFKKVRSLSLGVGLVFAGLWSRRLNHSSAFLVRPKVETSAQQFFAMDILESR